MFVRNRYRHSALLRLMRYSLSRAPSRLTVVIPRRFSLSLFLSIPLWIAAWVLIALIKPRGDLQSILVLTAFGLFTIFVAYRWLWNLSGKEELEFTTSELIYRRFLLGISRTRVFAMDRLTDPRFVPPQQRGRSCTPSGLGFSYDGEQVKVCDELTQEEANQIVAAAVQQLPELADRWGCYINGMFGYEATGAHLIQRIAGIRWRM